jgi:hypothetical protein
VVAFVARGLIAILRKRGNAEVIVISDSTWGTG